MFLWIKCLDTLSKLILQTKVLDWIISATMSLFCITVVFRPLQVKLYDHRLSQRGAVQSYVGHVNSHTRIQLGVDPMERFVMSGIMSLNSHFFLIFTGFSTHIYYFSFRRRGLLLTALEYQVW